MNAGTLTAIEAGAVQVTDLGRTRGPRFGVPANGALDQRSARVANILVGNADGAPLLEITPEDFDALMAVNLRGVFLCYTAAARQMIRQGGGGKIIGAASIAAQQALEALQ